MLVLFKIKEKIKSLLFGINWGGEMVANVGTFVASATIRLASSLILTRLLFPEAYGLVSMIGVVGFVIELMSDIGIVAFLIRHPRANESIFLNTVWSIRFVRAAINTFIIVITAHQVALWYATPLLEPALKIYSLFFIIKSLESISFLLALRNQNSRVVSFAELWGTLSTTIFTIVYAYFYRDHYGIIYGMLFGRSIVTIISYARSDRFWPKIAFEKNTAKDLFNFAKFVGPSSILTIFISQFDKVLILKLFDLKLLGLYGVATGIAAPIGQLISQINHNILYPRCVEYLRTSNDSARVSFYNENKKLFLITLTLPCIIGGFSTLIVNILFDNRYSGANSIVQSLCLSGLLSAFSLPSENILVAAGRPKMVLIGNIIRVIWLIPASYVGYTIWGFIGFVYAVSLSSLPVVLFFWQRRFSIDLIVLRKEILMVGYSISIWFISWFANVMILIGFNRYN